MAETVADILGKGLKFEQRTEISFIQSSLVGTTGCFIGAADWGPVNTPTFVSSKFEDSFGDPILHRSSKITEGTSGLYTTPTDASSLGIVDYLNYSEKCWFTRVTNGAATKSAVNCDQIAQAASITGSVKLKNTDVYSDPDAENLKIKYSGYKTSSALTWNGSTALTATLPAGTGGITASSLVVQVNGSDTTTVDDGVGGFTNNNDSKVAEVTDITFSGTPATDTYIQLEDGGVSYYAWADYGNLSTDPAPGGTGIAVDMIGTKNQSIGFEALAGSTIADNDYITFANTTAAFYVWFEVDGAGGVDPTPGGTDANSGAIAVAGTETASELATLIAAGIDAHADFTASASDTVVTFTSIDDTGAQFADLDLDTGITNAGWTNALLNAEVSTSISTSESAVAFNTAIDGHAKFASDVAGATVTVTNDTTGAITSFLDGDTGVVSFDITTYGSGCAITAAGSTINYDTGTISLVADMDPTSNTEITIYYEVSNLQHEFTVANSTQASITVAASEIDLLSSTISAIIFELDGYTASQTGPYSGAATSTDEKLAALIAIFEDSTSLTGADYLSKSGDNIVFGSANYGPDSTVTLIKLPGTSTYASAMGQSIGTDVSMNSIVTTLNTDLALSDLAGFITIGYDSDDYFKLATVGTGADYSLEVTAGTGPDTFYTTLGLTPDVVSTGTDYVSGCTLTAKYVGEGGNTLSYLQSEEDGDITLNFYFQNQLLGTLVNYTGDPDDEDNYLGVLISNDSTLSEFMDFSYSGSDMPNLVTGTTTYFSGGLSGEDSIPTNQYISAINAYKNMDLYEIDLIAICDVFDTDVIEALDDLCSYRKDCMAVIDPPPFYTVDEVIDWHNGEDVGMNTTDFDSEYLSFFYPWVLIPTENDALTNQWHGPSTRIMGIIANVDNQMEHQFAAPAGHIKAPIANISDLEQYFTAEEKAKLYADRKGNNINPLVYNKVNGYFNDGQKTAKRGQDPMNRISALRTSLHLKKEAVKIAPEFFWSPIDPVTKDRFQEKLESILKKMEAARAIKPADDADWGWTVATDSSINTPEVEADHGLIGVIEWTPIKSVEKIKIVSIVKDEQIQFVAV